jgi:hypothetical protein
MRCCCLRALTGNMAVFKAGVNTRDTYSCHRLHLQRYAGLPLELDGLHPTKNSRSSGGCTEMGCARQHIRGHNAVHTGQKCCLQSLLRNVCGFRCHEILNENRTMFTVPTGKQRELQADTALIRRSLSRCGEQPRGPQYKTLTTLRNSKTLLRSSSA